MKYNTPKSIDYIDHGKVREIAIATQYQDAYYSCASVDTIEERFVYDGQKYAIYYTNAGVKGAKIEDDFEV